MAGFKKYRSFCFVFLMVFGCGKATPTFEGIDLAAWKDDKNGCHGKRKAMTEPLRQQKNKLQGLSEMDIVGLLGRPDQNELYSRNQKFYYFFLRPGKACNAGTPTDTAATKLSIKFNATGLAKEIEIN